MPGLDGVELLKRAIDSQPDLTVILMTAFATVESAVEAMRSGAYDYLQKPFNKTELLTRIERVEERMALRRENPSASSPKLMTSLNLYRIGWGMFIFLSANPVAFLLALTA